MKSLRVLVVDDSSVFRQAVRAALESDPSIEVVGAAANGVIALKLIEQKQPEMVVLDVEMPEMDGIETLRCIQRSWPRVKTIMFSAHTTKGAAATLDALSLGAVDFVTKPTGGSYTQNIQTIQEELVPRIKACLTGEKPLPSARPAAAPPPPKAAPRLMAQSNEPPIVAIGVSTGGPNALHELLASIKPGFPSPIVITQHMPPIFTEHLAKRLDQVCPLSVSEARDGDRVEPGRAYVAPGDYHIEVIRPAYGRDAVIRTHQGPKECSCRPSVNVMFRSLAASHGANTIAAVLTGMGQDGFEGVKMLKACDAYIIAQDQASCVVYGMPSFIVNSGMADQVLPLSGIGKHLMDLVQPRGGLAPC
jgi:two-component system chemotaxis response regulator CheB